MKLMLKLAVLLSSGVSLLAQDTRIISFTEQGVCWTNVQTGGYATLDLTWNLTNRWYHFPEPYINIPVTNSVMFADLPLRDIDLSSLTNLSGTPVFTLFFRISSTTNPIADGGFGPTRKQENTPNQQIQVTR